MPAFSPDFNSITRRVRMDLPHILPSPYKEALETLPYKEWVLSHIAEIMTLKNAQGEALLLGTRARSGKTQSGTVFVTDLCFTSSAALEYYNQHWLSIMRGRLNESYTGATLPESPFQYRFAISDDKAAFDVLLDGITVIETIGALGALKAA
jgi:hypothetical protein